MFLRKCSFRACLTCRLENILIFPIDCFACNLKGKFPPSPTSWKLFLFSMKTMANTMPKFRVFHMVQPNNLYYTTYFRVFSSCEFNMAWHPVSSFFLVWNPTNQRGLANVTHLVQKHFKFLIELFLCYYRIQNIVKIMRVESLKI